MGDRDTHEEEQSKNNKKGKPKKSIKKKRKKEMMEKLENNIYYGDKSEQSKYSSDNNIVKIDKFIVNKSIKSQKTNEKKTYLRDNQSLAHIIIKKNLKIILSKSRKIESVPKNFIKKNYESDVEFLGIDSKNMEISGRSAIESEKNEFSKFTEISKTKVGIKTKKGKYLEYGKEGNNKGSKNYKNYNSEKDSSQKNRKKINYKRKNKKLNKKESYKNDYNENFEDGKKEKNNKKLKVGKKKE